MDWLLGPQAYDALALGAWSSQYYLVPLLAAAALALVFLGPKLSRSRPGHANRAEVRKGSDDSSSQEVSETEEDDEVQAKPPKARRRGVDEEAGRVSRLSLHIEREAPAGGGPGMMGVYPAGDLAWRASQ
jgi:hypothetical protein